MTWKSKAPEPRTKFCWWCSRKLQGREHVVVTFPEGDVCVHKACEEQTRAEAERREGK